MRARQRLGQHFLTDAHAIQRIVDASGVGPNDLVVEVGPGRGALTRELLKRGSRVAGIELDRSLCSLLQKDLGSGGRLEILNSDVLRVDLPALVRREGFESAVLVGNIPYNITGAVVKQVLDARAVFRRAVLMVQREVARRIVARPGGRAYGILSIAVQIRTSPEWMFDLSPEHFSPPPRVHSSVLRLDFSSSPPIRIEDEALFFHVVRTVFGQRRKMLRNTMQGLVGCREQLPAVLSAAGVDSRMRPEAVSAEQFERMSRELAAVSHTESRATADGGKGKQVGKA